MYRGIHYLRGVAATAVILKHASHPGGALERALDAGVDLFFVISGFVMVVSTYGKDISPSEFIRRRCERVLPMWWVTLAIVLVLGLGSGDWSAWVLSLLLIPTTINSGVGSVYWGVGWTLVFEVVFYAFFAAGLAFRSTWFVFAVLPTMVAVGLAVGRSDVAVLNDAMHPLLLEFVTGALVARLMLAGKRPPLLYAGLGVALLMVGAQVGGGTDIRPLTLGLPMALVVASLAAADLPKVRFLTLLGDASYSMYLLHYIPILLVWSIVPQDSYWAVTFALALGVGISGHIFVERPLLASLRSRRTFAVTPHPV
jgi:exopolysaccharide production protein ExoZ